MPLMPEEKRQLPPWLLGLLIAIAVFGIGLLVAAALGFGDDPVLDPDSTGAIQLMIGL